MKITSYLSSLSLRHDLLIFTSHFRATDFAKTLQSNYVKHFVNWRDVTCAVPLPIYLVLRDSRNIELICLLIRFINLFQLLPVVVRALRASKLFNWFLFGPRFVYYFLISNSADKLLFISGRSISYFCIRVSIVPHYVTRLIHWILFGKNFGQNFKCDLDMLQRHLVLSNFHKNKSNCPNFSVICAQITPSITIMLGLTHSNCGILWEI